MGGGVCDGRRRWVMGGGCMCDGRRRCVMGGGVCDGRRVYV